MLSHDSGRGPLLDRRGVMIGMGASLITRAAAWAAPRASVANFPANVQAVLYALPLVIMDVTREETLSRAGAMPNRFLNIPILANASFRTVVRPNVDTLYSTAWLDLSAGPAVMTLPPSNGRFYMIQCMDAWTNNIADPGVRTLGNNRAQFEIIGPEWHGQILPGAEVIRAPTRMVWVLARVFVRNDADLSGAREYQSQLDIRPLSRLNDLAFHSTYPFPGKRKRDPIMMDVLKAMGAEAFFQRFLALTVANPPAPEDAPFIKAVLARLGITPGQPRGLGEHLPFKSTGPGHGARGRIECVQQPAFHPTGTSAPGERVGYARAWAARQLWRSLRGTSRRRCAGTGGKGPRGRDSFQCERRRNRPAPGREHFVSSDIRAGWNATGESVLVNHAL